MSDIYKAPSAELQDTIPAGQYGSVETAIAGQYNLNIRELLGESWRTLKGLKTTFWIATIMYIVVVVALQFVMGFVTTSLALSGSLGLIIGGTILQQVVLILVSTPLGLGLFMIALKHSVDAPTTFGEIFNYFNKAGKFLLTYIIMYIMIILGLILLVLPGIYLMFAYMMSLPLIAEKNMGAWEALETSRKAITKKWFKFAGLFLLFMIIIVISMIPLGIGLIWTLPWMALSFAILYRNMFGIDDMTTHQ